VPATYRPAAVIRPAAAIEPQAVIQPQEGSMLRGMLRPTVIGLTLLALTAMPAAADKPVGPKLQVKPGTFVGAADACFPGSPAGTPGGVKAAWRTHKGLPDAGRSDHALVLTKSVDTTDCSSAFARVRGVSGLPALTLGFDYREDSYCGAGSARFNVLASDGFHFVGGCANGTPVPAGTDRRGADWLRVTFDLTDPTVAFPAVAPGATLVSVSILQDEQGTSILDNISVNGKRIGKPGRR
jgi:hypothetical protein